MIRFILSVVTAFFIHTFPAFAQPAPGTYNFDGTSPTILASSNGTLASTPLGNGFTASLEGNGATASIRIAYVTSLLTQTLRFDRSAAPATVSKAILSSTNGGRFRLRAITYLPFSAIANTTITMTARRNGVTIGSVTGLLQGNGAGVPFTKRTLDVATNADFYNIDEIWFTGIDVGIHVDDIEVAAVTTLPVVLLSFDAKPTEKGVELNWKTTEETKNSHFEIQRSTDGRNFETLTTVSPVQHSQPVNSYTYIDDNAVAGKSFYRLVQHDIDGVKSYLGIRSVNKPFAEKVTVVTNQGSILVKMNRPVTETIPYVMVNMSGAVVQKGGISSQSHTVAANGLSAGVYILRLSSGETIRFRIN